MAPAMSRRPCPTVMPDTEEIAVRECKGAATKEDKLHLSRGARGGQKKRRSRGNPIRRQEYWRQHLIRVQNSDFAYMYPKAVVAPDFTSETVGHGRDGHPIAVLDGTASLAGFSTEQLRAELAHREMLTAQDVQVFMNGTACLPMLAGRFDLKLGSSEGFVETTFFVGDEANCVCPSGDYRAPPRLPANYPAFQENPGIRLERLAEGVVR